VIPPGSDDPESIQHDEARQELYGRGRARGGAGTEIGTFLLVIIAIIGGAIAFEEIDHWSQWVVLGGIVGTVIGFMIAVSPNRRGA
jgi:hypothetical protein